MTSTFLGKWRLHPTNTNEGYAAYQPRPGQKPHFVNLLCLWFVNSDGGPYPADKETNIAFILRTDSKLCFLMNNGKHLGFGTGFVDTLAEATGFVFPGHDFRNLPPQFTSRIQSLHDGMFLFETLGHLISGVIENAGLRFAISQVTPPLTSVQASRKGDRGDFAWLDLTDVKLTNCSLKKAQFNNCIMVGTDFSGANLSGANLSHVDLSGVVANPIPELYLKPLAPPSPDNPRTNFAGSHLKQSFIGNDWSMLDLTGATILDLSSPLSSETKPLKVKQSILTDLNQRNLSDLSLQHASFDNSVLDNLNLNGADLTGASLIQASMHGTVLSNAILKNTTMTGAQLGSLAHLFTLPAGYENRLKSGPLLDTGLRNHFEEHGITLPQNATLNTAAPGRVWHLNDAENNLIYTMRREDESTELISVFGASVAASLVNAYMPDAVLTGANLYGVIASGAQLYGSKALVDGAAILERIEFDHANLSNLNLTQANLYGANLSGAHLFNAKFNKANLSPSADNVATNLSNANLQGAIFTGARLDKANLTNAAVAINVAIKAGEKRGGVYLFSLPYGNDDPATIEQYKSELTAAAATFFSLNPDGNADDLNTYLTALKSNNLTRLKIAFLKKKITLSKDAQIQFVEKDSVWQIVDGNKSYTLWTDPDERGNTELYAASSLTITQAGFRQRNTTLRFQISTLTDTPGQMWLLDNDSENPKNFSTGYVRFIVKLNGKVLDVYGTALRILRLGNNNKQEFKTETCQITTISQTNMDADTICPNGSSLGVNQARSGKKWDDLWLRAATPPRPPDCVPTDFNFCPPPPRKKED